MAIDKLMLQSTAEVSVILACRNEEDFIEDCVRSILDQEVSGGIEVIVADGMSTDGTRNILRRLALTYDRVKILDNPGLIVSTGLNAAISIARGRIVMRMDAHTMYARDYICQCVAVLQQTGVDNVGGPARTLGNGYVQTGISAAYHSPFAVGGARFHDPDYEGYVDTIPYGCWSREVFSRIGMFDEELVRNQDDEFNLRLIRSGGRIWQSPRIKSWYRTRGSLIDLFRQYRQYGYWKVRVIQKHKLPASIRHLVPGSFLFLLLALLLISFWWSPALWGLIGLLGIYIVITLAASILTAYSNGWTLLPLLPLVFAIYHFGYGLGFLRGILDFVVLHRRPSRSLMILSRRSASQ